MNLGGLDKDKELIEARKICAFCEKEFDENERKTEVNNNFYHLNCYNELQYKINEYIHDPHKK